MTNENETDRSDGGIVNSKPKKKKSKKKESKEVQEEVTERKSKKNSTKKNQPSSRTVSEEVNNLERKLKKTKRKSKKEGKESRSKDTSTRNVTNKTEEPSEAAATMDAAIPVATPMVIPEANAERMSESEEQQQSSQPPLRFKVGDSVLCYCKGARNSWRPGIVTALNYRKDHWPASRANALYKVMLEEDNAWKVIYVDDDKFCKKADLQHNVRERQLRGNGYNPGSSEDPKCRVWGLERVAFVSLFLCVLVIGIIVGLVVRCVNTACLAGEISF